MLERQQAMRGVEQDTNPQLCLVVLGDHAHATVELGLGREVAGTYLEVQMRDAIRGHQGPSEAIRGHQRPSEAIGPPAEHDEHAEHAENTEPDGPKLSMMSMSDRLFDL
jgi:hypothetical protein